MKERPAVESSGRNDNVNRVVWRLLDAPLEGVYLRLPVRHVGFCELRAALRKSDILGGSPP